MSHFIVRTPLCVKRYSKCPNDCESTFALNMMSEVDSSLVPAAGDAT